MFLLDPKILHYISLLMHLCVRRYVIGLVCNVVISQKRVLHVHSLYPWENYQPGNVGRTMLAS